jgi:Two component regulator propeller
VKIYLPILFLILFYIPCSAQKYAVSVQHLSIEQGLSNRFVNSIFQDSKGFIWFATNSGVNRWDGYEMKVFAENVAVWSVMEDADGRIWFRYSFDENFFLGYPEKFPLHLNALPNDTLLPTEWTLVANMEGSILLQSKKDGSIYSYNNRLIAHPGVNRFLVNSNEVPIAPISKDRFWVAIGNAIQLMDLDGKIYEKTPIANGQKQLIPPELSNLIYSSLQIKTNNGIIWEGKTHQLQAKDRNGKVIFDFYDYLGSTLPSSNFIIDEHNNAWICSDNGVYRVSINPSPFATYLAPQGPPRYSVRGMLLRGDSLLIHTYGGSKMVSVANGGFVPLKNTPPHIGQAIGNFLDKDSILFWGEGIGIRRYDLRSGQYQFFERKSISDISYLPYRDKKSGTLWVAGNKRTHILNESSGQIEDIQFEGDLQPIYIRHFFEDEKGLWLVARNGLFLTDALTRKLISVYTPNSTTFIRTSKASTGWLPRAMGCSAGIRRMVPTKLMGAKMVF